MSRARFLKTIALEQTDRIPSYEWIDHPEFLIKLTGIDPYVDPENSLLAAMKKLDLDCYVGLPKFANKFEDGESSRKTDNGQIITKWGFSGSYWSHPAVLFQDDESVLNYNPFAVTTLEERQKNHKNYVDSVLRDTKIVGDTCFITGNYYTTLFQWFIMTFGWEPFLLAAASSPKRFETVIEHFTQMSIEYAEYFAKCEIPIFLCHDDLAISRGLVFDKSWYVKYIFPAYERIFEPAKKAGKPIFFVSDGKYSELIPELIASGVDGLIIDHFNDLDPIMKTYGGKHMICGNVHIDILTYGTREDVKKEVLRCVEYGKRYPGYIIRVSADLPDNIPLENIETYFDCVREYGRL